MRSPSGFAYTRTAGTGTTFPATATLETPGGSVTAATNNTTTVAGQTHSGRTNVTIAAFDVTDSTDAAIPAGTGLAHTNNFAPSLSLKFTDFGGWTIDASASASRPQYVGGYGGGKPGEALSGSVPSTGSATYSGGAAGYVSQPNSTNAIGTLATFFGSLGLTADFAAGTISGSITNIQGFQIGRPSGAASGTINDVRIAGTISGAALAGTVSASGAAGTLYDIGGATGALTGGFFGPSAAEVAGSFALTGGANNVSVVGGFGAAQTTAASDRRLKRGLRHEGRWPNGLPRWSWRYLGEHRRFAGVLAQDVAADPRFAPAVIIDPSGLMRVNYGLLGIAPADMTAMRSEGEAAAQRYLAWRRGRR